jgi:hypothetical protein
MIFPRTNNVALNDICVYNLANNEWEPLVMFGQMPCSRWGHTAVGSADYKDLPPGWDHPLKDTLFIFGGISLNSYCRSKVYSFKF